MEKETKQCPYCGNEILKLAKKCKYCGEWIKEDNNTHLQTKRCPFCGEEILAVATKCKYCRELLNNNVIKEARDKELPYFKKMPTFLLCVLISITYGIYLYYWIIKSTNTFNRIADKMESYNDRINIALPIICIVATVIGQIVCWYSIFTMKFFWLYWLLLIPITLLQYVIVYKMLRIIEIYAYKTTGKIIRHHAFCWWFFNTYYVNFAINTYTERLERAR